MPIDKVEASPVARVKADVGAGQFSVKLKEGGHSCPPFAKKDRKGVNGSKVMFGIKEFITLDDTPLLAARGSDYENI